MNYELLSEDDVSKLIQGFATKQCLLDCIPTWFVKDNTRNSVPILTKLINTSLTTGVFPNSLKYAIISPIIKKPSVDNNILKNYGQISNIKFLSKVIDLHVVKQIVNHMISNGFGEPLKSA